MHFGSVTQMIKVQSDTLNLTMEYMKVSIKAAYRSSPGCQRGTRECVRGSSRGCVGGISRGCIRGKSRRCVRGRSKGCVSGSIKRVREWEIQSVRERVVKRGYKYATQH